MSKENSKKLKNEDINDAAKVIGAIVVGGAAIYGVSKLGNWLFGSKDEHSNALPERGWDFFKKADLALQSSNFEEAERYARLCSNLSPNNPDVNNLISTILYYQNKDLEEAITLSQKAIHFAPNKYAQGFYYGTLSDVYYLRGNWKLAIEAGNTHLSILKENNHQPFPPNQWSIWKLAICFFELQEYKGALEQYEKALNLEPNNPNKFRILTGIANSKSNLEMYIAATDYYNYALDELKKNMSIPQEMKNIEACNILNDLGVLNTKLGEKEKSIKYYTEAISRNQNNPFPFANMSGFFAEQGDVNKMRRFLEGAIRVIDPSFTPHKDLINHIVHSKDYRKNSECFQTMISLFVSNHLLTKERGDLLLNTNIESQDFYISDRTKQNLKLLISKNKIQEAIDELMKVTFKRKRKYNFVIELSAKLQRVEREGLLSLISKEQENLERSQIENALVEVIDKLTD